MKNILLDTNFLLIPAQFNVHIFSEIDRIILEKHELFVLDKTIDELNNIIKADHQKLKNKRAAKLALELLQAKDVNIIKTKEDKYVDDIIVELEGYIVATQDIELKKRLKAKDINIITLRGKQRLILT